MRAKLVVFPIRGRNWCFSRSVDHTLPASSASSQSPSTLKELWTNIHGDPRPLNAKAELLVDYVSHKMNSAWIGLENAPDGSLKSKIHVLGLWLLSRVKPSEIFLKSISKEITSVEVIYPSSLNAQLVRRRLRHIAMRGTIIHRKYFYGSVSLIPLTSALCILPLPNVPFFWVLFRTYSHWRALQGSEKLFQLVSDGGKTSNTCTDKKKTEHMDSKNESKKTEHKDSKNESKKTEHQDSKNESYSMQELYWVLQPSEELENLVRLEDGHDGLSPRAITNICKIYDLNTRDVIKYEKTIF